LASSHGELARLLLGRIAFLKLLPAVLACALEPFPVPVRTLDALHLASAEFLRCQGQKVAVATYDGRLALAARSLKLDLVDL